MDWEKPGLLRFFVFMPLQFLIQFGLILLYEAGYFRNMKYKLSSLLKRNVKVENGNNDLEDEEKQGDIKKDEDVTNEEKRIETVSKSIKVDTNIQEIFVVNRLKKFYSNFMAVRGISFGLKTNECFGLLGINGAGKTTTFKMITGDESISDGDAYLNGISIKSNIKRFQKHLGYCPQFDPLIDQMTVLETMEMYANLRGIRSELVRKTCLSLINLLDLNDHINKMCYTLSGGNKRKLSVAISLVGSPIIVLLDEPTSGMDPKTRRTLWNCLNNIRNKGKSLILTTHSMDETEASCSNIGIMVNGELKCLGSLQHLKSKYGDGYTLLTKVSLNQENHEEQQRNVKELTEFVLQKFENNCHLKESRDGYVNFHLNDNSTSTLANVFSVIEEVKVKYSIEYYVVTQTKLEQIFLNFASRQIDPETRLRKNRRFCG